MVLSGVSAVVREVQVQQQPSLIQLQEHIQFQAKLAMKGLSSIWVKNVRQCHLYLLNKGRQDQTQALALTNLIIQVLKRKTEFLRLKEDTLRNWKIKHLDPVHTQYKIVL